MSDVRYTTLMVKKDLKEEIERVRAELRLRNYSDVIKYLIKVWEEKENGKD